MTPTLQWIGKLTVMVVFFAAAKGVSKSIPVADNDAGWP